MIYRHPQNRKIIWKDGQKGRPPKWVVELKNFKPKKVKVPKNKDPVFSQRQILTDGVWRVNGRVIHVDADSELITCEGDSICKMIEE